MAAERILGSAESRSSNSSSVMGLTSSSSQASQQAAARGRGAQHSFAAQPVGGGLEVQYNTLNLSPIQI